MPAMNNLLPALAAAGTLMLAGAGLAQVRVTETKADRHAGYYYPPPQTVEVYTARARVLPGSTRERRLAFVIGLTGEMARQPYPPQYVVFAKGSEAEKLIIVGLAGGTLGTIYRARAVLANLTSVARATPLFAELGVQNSFTFFDLAKLLGFRRITVSDGRAFAHQISIE